MPLFNTKKKITPDEKILHRETFPSDYHVSNFYSTGNFLGEIYDTENDCYYTNTLRRQYLPKLKDSSMKHNNPGHFVGYRWAIQQLTEEGDIVFDPTVGTGTAIFEAENNGRKGIGIELEFPETTKYLCEGRGTVISGNALEVDLKDYLPKESIQLLINGTPYPTLNGRTSSDTYFTFKDQNYYGDYKDRNNIGKWKLPEYKARIHELYTRFIPYVKTNGFLCIIIKDPTHLKKPFLLHELITESILENNDCLKYYGSFLHKHLPQTLFMRTYPKRFGVEVPTYQTGIILQKI